MKLLKLTLAVVGFTLLFNANANAQVVVKVRPNRPNVIVKKPAKVKRGYVWVAGNWKWDKRRKKYIWVKGRQVKARRGYKYTPGHWVAVNGGSKWVAGRWKRV